MSRFEFPIFQKKECLKEMDENERLLRQYLEKQSYGTQALEATVQDVFALDEDWKEYVFRFLQTGKASCAIACECASITDLLQAESFTPVTAALWIQWYRREPARAAAFLLRHDRVEEIPDTLPEPEE